MQNAVFECINGLTKEPNLDNTSTISSTKTALSLHAKLILWISHAAHSNISKSQIGGADFLYISVTLHNWANYN